MNHMTRRNQRAFTLIELLVVIVIIAILVGLVAGAGVAVLGNRDVRNTENVLNTLDRALSDYMTDNADSPPPWNAGLYENVPGSAYHADAGGDNDVSNSDAWVDLNGREYPRHPDAAVFIRVARGFGAVDSILGEMGDRWLVATPESGNDEATPNVSDVSPSVLDAWSNAQEWGAPWPILGAVTPIYYVHPGNELAQRLYGRCTNGRPYFFSAGPDRKYGSTTHESGDGQQDSMLADAALESLEDNLYSSQPGAPDRTDDFRTIR